MNWSKERFYYKWKYLGLLALSSFLFCSSVKLAGQSLEISRDSIDNFRYGFQVSFYEDSLLFDSLFDVGKGNPQLISFEERMLFSIELNKSEDLYQWLDTTTLPNAAEISGIASKFLLQRFPYMSWRRKYLKKLEEKVLIAENDQEIKEFILIFLNYKMNPAGDDLAVYNKRVLTYLDTYKDSEAAIFCGNHLNKETSLTQKVAGAFVISGSGILQAIQSQGISSGGWELGALGLRTYTGRGNNYYGFNGLFVGNLELTPEFVGKYGPISKCNYTRVCFRYDRNVIDRRRFNTSLFADLGAGGLQIYYPVENEEELEIERFFTTSAGLRMNWNIYIVQGITEVDTLYDAAKISLGLEFSYIHNYYNFMNVYRDMLFVSITLGGHLRFVEPRKNSGLSKLLG